MKYLLGALLLIPVSALAEEEINWFPVPKQRFQADRMGNQYHVTEYANGSVRVNGFNPYNGATWNSQSDSRGMTGTDAYGNFVSQSNSVSPQEQQMNRDMVHIGNSLGRFAIEGK